MFHQDSGTYKQQNYTPDNLHWKVYSFTGKNTKIKNTIIRNNVGYGSNAWLKSLAALFLNDYAVAEGVVVSNISIRYFIFVAKKILP